METIYRMETKIEEMVALADAHQEMSEEFSGNALEKRFAELDASGADVESELLELKQRARIEDKSGG